MTYHLLLANFPPTNRSRLIHDVKATKVDNERNVSNDDDTAAKSMKSYIVAYLMKE